MPMLLRMANNRDRHTGIKPYDGKYYFTIIATRIIINIRGLLVKKNNRYLLFIYN